MYKGTIMAKRKTIDLVCTNCKISFQRKVSETTVMPKRAYCSRACKSNDKNSYKSEWTDERRERYSKMMSGENNPNFGNQWSTEQKKHLSDFKKQQYKDNPALAYECGKSNRGVKFDSARVYAMHGHRNKESYSHPHTEETKLAIGELSKKKFTDEFKQKQRALMEKNGHWVPLAEKDPYNIYYKDANWKESMIDFFDHNALVKLNEYGIFSKTNTKGWVRDHIAPRKLGYEYQIPSVIMRHPANLQFISHAENVSKGVRDRRLTEKEKDSIIELLFNKILDFDGVWDEHEECIKLINERRSV